jgi:phosphoserine phosphatase RsbX
METVSVSALEYGVARFVRPGEGESGDQHLVCSKKSRILIAAMDGIGHGAEAAAASRTASSILEAEPDEPIISLVRLCHEGLRKTRGVVLSLAYIDATYGMMTWLGVGNVQGMLMRAGAKRGTVQETLLLRGGVVGAQLPPLQATVLPIARGDTLIFATDGVRNSFVESLAPMEAPQYAADRILKAYHHGNDDALVMLARYTGGSR